MATPFTTNAQSPFGSVILAIPAASPISYVVNGSYDPQHPTRMPERRDINGDVSDFELRSELTTLQCNIQLATSVTTVPPRGVTFTAPGMNGFPDELMVIKEVKLNKPQDNFWTCDITAVGIAVVNAQ